MTNYNAGRIANQQWILPSYKYLAINLTVNIRKFQAIKNPENSGFFFDYLNQHIANLLAY